MRGKVGLGGKVRASEPGSKVQIMSHLATVVSEVLPAREIAEIESTGVGNCRKGGEKRDAGIKDDFNISSLAD